MTGVFKVKYFLLGLLYFASLATILVTYLLTTRIAEQARENHARFVTLSRSPEQTEKLKSQFATISAQDIKKLEQFYPKFAFEELLPFRSALLNIKSVQFKIVDNVPKADEEGRQYVSFTIDLNGTVDDFREYLISLGRLPYLITVERATITDSINVKGVVPIHIDGRLYVRSA